MNNNTVPNMTCSCWGTQGQSRSLSHFTTKRLIETLKGPGSQGSQKICVVNELPNIATPASNPTAVYTYTNLNCFNKSSIKAIQISSIKNVQIHEVIGASDSSSKNAIEDVSNNDL